MPKQALRLSAQPALDFLALQQQKHSPDPARNISLEIIEQLRCDPGNERWFPALAKVASELRDSMPGRPGQDVGSHAILAALVAEVEAACRRIGIDPLPGTTVGTIYSSDVNAFNAGFYKTTSLVVVHVPMLMLALLLAKAVVYCAFSVDKNGQIQFVAPTDEADLDHAAARVANLALALKDSGDPSGAQPDLTPLDSPYLPAIRGFIHAIEFFVIAHEYAHLLEEYDRSAVSVTPKDGDDPERFGPEIAADATAVFLATAGSSGPIHPIAVMGPAALMTFLAMMEEEGYLPRPAQHPDSATRLRLIRAAVQGLTTLPNAPGNLQGVLDAITHVEKSLSAAWGRAKDKFIAKPEY